MLAWDLLLLIVIAPVAGAVAIARIWGPVSAGAPVRYAEAIGVAVALNILAIPTLNCGYFSLVMVPAACFCISAVVAAAAGRHAFVCGPLACPWFLLPSIIQFRLTASTEHVAAYALPPSDRFTMFTLSCGLLGAFVVHVAWPRKVLLRHGESHPDE